MPTLRRSVTRFVVLFPGRSGSTYVISALDAHPQVAAKGEVLDPLRPEGPEAQLDWTRRFFRGRFVSPYKAVGFKTKLRDVLDQDGFARILDEYDARLVYLDRRNDVKHAISRITARRLKDTTGRWNRYDGDARLDAFPVDVADFEERLGAVEAEKATIAEYVEQAGPAAPPPRLRGPPRRPHRGLPPAPRLPRPPAGADPGHDPQEHERRPPRGRHQLRRAARPLRRHPLRADVRRGPRPVAPRFGATWYLQEGFKSHRKEDRAHAEIPVV